MREGGAMQYPPADRSLLVEHLHGNPVSDPYRWLEDADSAATRTWVAAQDDLARPYLDALPGREEWADDLRRLLAAGAVATPALRRDRGFFTRRAGDQQHAVLTLRTGGTDRVLLDPAALDPS